MKKKGFTLVELLATIIILGILSIIVVPIIVNLITNVKKSAFEDSSNELVDVAIKGYYTTSLDGPPTKTTYTYTDSVQTKVSGNIEFKYGGPKPKNGTMIIDTDGTVALAIHNGEYCATKIFDKKNVTIEEKTVSECKIALADESGANAPVLATGMTPVIWDTNTSTWIEASNIDDVYKQNWYDYANKKWANAMTEDGSMWVWIPRYAYQITSGYHTNTAGTIDIKFLQGATNTTLDSTTIYEDNATNTHFVQQPAFTFGGTEITGMWVAKFETSGTTASLDYKPGVASLRSKSVANMFTSSRNMETNNKYGWELASVLTADGTFTTDTNNVDTHMMKNVEWGAVLYLSQSIYGKNSELYINNSSTFITGCSGGGTNTAGYSGCQYAYNTVQGQGASTTGTIYGIYDMSGGAWEFVMGNYNNTAGSSGLTPSAINDKYIDRYTAYNDTKYGDAIYETSSGTNIANSWYGDYTYMIDASNPWFNRGCLYNSGSIAGSFGFYYDSGGGGSYRSWRSVVFVGTGL